MKAHLLWQIIPSRKSCFHQKALYISIPRCRSPSLFQCRKKLRIMLIKAMFEQCHMSPRNAINGSKFSRLLKKSECFSIKLSTFRKLISLLLS
ncbi:hypothetical protein THIOM_003296 [Candidatus Thiomargarita nelsonii]|uniref:Uncharacterized protein n=1 Tax=Candidatus Thiomargarita nelsonii TaxID=1003181 RepID=A0A176RZ18_9GAMM|nr:hypothetical protein THIOM_003296 [Candidatus Thiomargarita nelsonii]